MFWRFQDFLRAIASYYWVVVLYLVILFQIIQIITDEKQTTGIDCLLYVVYCFNVRTGTGPGGREYYQGGK